MIRTLILFDMLYYTHVNEDNRVERQLLQKSGQPIVVAVAGSGERVIALMDIETCKELHVVDVNKEALFLLQLKLVALEILSVEDYFRFCGYYPAPKNARIAWFIEFKHYLNGDCKMYWEKNIPVIQNGIAYAGHFEKFLHRIRPMVNTFLGKKFQLAFSENPSDSKEFPKKKWKLLSKTFSYIWIYKLWGNKDTAFISNDAAISQIPLALNEIIYKGEAGSCFMTHLIFKGHLLEMKEDALPPSLQKKVLQKIKERLHSSGLIIRYYHTDMLSFALREKNRMGKPVFYSVSDILSFENSGYLQQLIDIVVSPGSTIVWRTFLRNRVTEIMSSARNSKLQWFQNHSDCESTRMYQVFSIQQEPG